MKKEIIRRSERMVAIYFEKLFGRFDYEVVLNQEGLTILTGPNGYGKSTILKSIEAIGNEFAGIMFFFSLDFKKITAVFKNDKTIVIEKDKDSLILNGIVIDGQVFRSAFEEVMERRPYFMRIDEDTWIDRRRGIRYSTNEYLSEIYMKDRRGLTVSEQRELFSMELLELLQQMKQLIGTVYFIKEQRLIREKRNNRDEQEVINVIEELPEKFKGLIGRVQQEYSDISSKLDSTYPNRLFENEERISEDEYKQKMQDMMEKFEKMIKYDLSTMQITSNFVFRDEHAKALKIYFDDFEVKYGVYRDFIDKLELYTDIINNRLSFKNVRISKDCGIDIVDENQKQLRLNQLSSGEKQEIVLFYDLIFGTQENILLMIDEPEISLHITWQKKFMDDLLRIIIYKGINVIVATHSPQIINNHWERQIDLGELYGEQLDKK